MMVYTNNDNNLRRGALLMNLLRWLVLLVVILENNGGVVVVNAVKHKTRSLARVNDPEEAWEQIKLRSKEELLEILNKLEIPIDEDDVDVNDIKELRTFVYDEDAMERWFKEYPEEITKYKKEKKQPAASKKTATPEQQKTKEEASSGKPRIAKKAKSSSSSFSFSSLLDNAKDLLGLGGKKEEL